MISRTKLALILTWLAVTTATFTLWETNVPEKIAMMKSGTHNPYRDFNQLLNSIVLDNLNLQFASKWAIDNFGPEAGYFVQCYIRDLIAGTLVYWTTASLWHFIIYNVFGKKLFTDKSRPLPSRETLIDQMCLAQSSLLIYAGVPIMSEILVENNLTQVYFYLDQVGGWGMYALYFVLYIAVVEIGIYWVHRTLHTNKFLYKYIHGLHHKYNKQSTMTPWASIAFNPLDGVLQASPYVLALFFVPMHYYTHMILLFFSGIWATNIHDAIWGDSEPVMGAKYHLVHHTHYHYNFGQFFIFCDYFWGTLKVPEKSKMD